jgi:hypothetical protein
LDGWKILHGRLSVAGVCPGTDMPQADAIRVR